MSASDAKTFLVTGGAGFIGSHLCGRLAAAGRHARVVDNLSTGRRENVPPGAEFIEGDVTDPQVLRPALAGVDTVFHLAARVSIRHSVETFLEDAQTNLFGTLTVLKAASAAGIRRFIFASSMAVYADSPPGEPFGEDHATEPLSPYGIAKLAAERYVLMLAPQLGLEPVVMRLFNTFGPGQGYTPYVGVLTIFATRILRGERCTIFGDGEQQRDFTHVKDVAEAFLLASDAPEAPGEIFNIGSGSGTSVNRLAELVREALGAGEFERAPADPTELRYSVADISKARAMLGYRPKGRLSERLLEVVEDIRARAGRAAAR